jgi:hypothetical protein
MKLQQSDFKSA